MLVYEAGLIWNNLKGLVCLYKPAQESVTHIRSRLLYKICKELNEMEVRKPIDHVTIDDKFEVQVKPNLADDVMVVGPRYQMDDLLCSWANHLGRQTSGVVLFGLRSGTSLAKRIRENFPTRAYRLKGVLGIAMDNHFHDGKAVERGTYKHIKLFHLERLLSNMQAAHQRKVFEISGVDIQSQAAYELASGGLIRPSNAKVPIIYGIKCVEFAPPNFTIELQCINENELYLMTLIHEIGMRLHTVAYCDGIQCIRHSCFTLDDALLRKDWNLQKIVTNMEHCGKLLNQYENALEQKSAILN